MNTKQINALALAAYLALGQLDTTDFQDFVTEECQNSDAILDALGEASSALLKVRRAIIRAEQETIKETNDGQ